MQTASACGLSCPSPAPGRGLRLTPKRAGGEPGRRRRARGADDRPLLGVRVLVVEDESFVAMDLAAALQDLGGDVIGVAATREGALELARAGRPQLAIVDVRLKDGETGVEAARIMAADLGVAIVFATAHTDPGLVARMSAVPGAARLFKPYDPDALEAAARQVLRRN